MLLDNINEPNDIKKISKSQYSKLALEIRQFLVKNVSKTGGHLASNLGAVELTMALHLALDLPKDKIIWDVGHQSYVHKILTGRKEEFTTLRQYNGLSGFPKRSENDCDCFDTGHSSTSISAGLGMVWGNVLNNDDSTVVAVIGDGALTGGLAYEALNNASCVDRNFIIILNDNNMSISENVGGMSSYLSDLRLGEAYNDLKAGVQKTLNKVPVIGDSLVRKIKRTKSSIKQLLIPGMLFEDMGITYVGPVDGHNVNKMTKIIKEAKKVDHPVLIHVITTKGKGYKYAEENPSKFHGIDPFVIKTGEVINKNNKQKTNTDIFSEELVKLAKKDKKIVAITAAMPDGTGLMAFKEKYPDRFFDVGIAEEYAVTFAAGLAVTGQKPFFAVYSSFLQRSYDQLIHDVCIQKLPVKIMVDRAGLVGRDGETHQGIFDISFLSSMPNMTVISPKDDIELRAAVDFAANYDYPVAVRYSRGEAVCGEEKNAVPIEYGKSEIIISGSEVALFAVGNMVSKAMEVAGELRYYDINATVVNARFLKPIDEEMVERISKNHKHIFTIEEGIINGGYGENILKTVNTKNLDVKVHIFGIEDRFVCQGDVETLRKEIGLDNASLIKGILKEIK